LIRPKKEEEVSTVEERVDRLESILGQFIVHTDMALRRLEAEKRAFREDMERFREEAERDRKKRDEEMERFRKEMERLSKKMDKQLQEYSEKVDRQIEEMKREAKEARRESNRMWSDLAKKMGTLVEDLIAPALRPVLKKYFNCEVTMEGQRMWRRLNGHNYEVDAVAACEDKVFMVEVRSKPRVEDVREIVEKSKRFFRYFPEYEGRQLVVIFGGITFPEEVLKYASRKGIYVLGWREWEYMDILNFEEVRAQTGRRA